MHRERADGQSRTTQTAMKPDTARFLASSVVVAMVAVTVLLAAVGARDFETYLAVVLVAIFAGFVASTQPV